MVSIDGFVYILNPNLWHKECKLSDLRNVYKIYLNFYKVFSFEKQWYSLTVLHIIKKKSLEMSFENLVDSHLFSK